MRKIIYSRTTSSPYEDLPSLHTEPSVDEKAVRIDIVLLDQFCQLLCLGDKVDWACAHDLISNPLLVLEGIHLRSTSEYQSLAIGVLEDVVKLPLIALILDLRKIVRTHTHDESTNVVEAAEPKHASVITDIDGHDVAVFRLRVCEVALFASPLARINLNNLFVTSVAQTCWVGDIVLFDVDDCGLE